MSVAGGGGRWHRVFLFLGIFTKGFGLCLSMGFCSMRWGVYLGGYAEGGCPVVPRGVWVPLGACLRDGCDGFVGGVIAMGACAIVFAILVGGLSVSRVSYPVWVCCSTHVGMG